MRILTLRLILPVLIALSACQNQPRETIRISGLDEPVELYRDGWGVVHIYARNQRDLFFAQGYNAARDRLFQLEIWRRMATGTLSEAFGQRFLANDMGARLLRFRGDMREEMAHYHPDGEEIITSFVRGINAYIGSLRDDLKALPPEFQLLGLRPGLWTPEVVVSRHNGLFRNAEDEILLAQLAGVTRVGRLPELIPFQPPDPRLPVDIDLAEMRDEILALYQASRRPPAFEPSDLAAADLPKPLARPMSSPASLSTADPGSNNWALSGNRTTTGAPFLANDPHRSLQMPSLRYFVHLSAPGWDVIGGGEPALPGVSIGHNRKGAWGLTIFAIDQEDLYVYETNPEDPLLYRYGREWERMRVEVEHFQVSGSEATSETFLTRHGPVLFRDLEKHRAYALRAAWLEVGTAPYLASLRIDQAQSWQEFRQACSFFRTPSENMLWADVEGNIGWQATGIAPIRPNWDGLLPVPGDGRYEWRGFLAPEELPSLLNPEQGYLATANQYNLPEGYPHRLGFDWSAPFRFQRISEVLSGKRKLSLQDMTALQLDHLSIPARRLVPLLPSDGFDDPLDLKALALLRDWDWILHPDSAAAAVYALWERRVVERIGRLYLPPEAPSDLQSPSLVRVLEWLAAPGPAFGEEPRNGRDDLLRTSLSEAVDELRRRLGDNPADWRYGDARFHHVAIQHALSGALPESQRSLYAVGPTPRGGNRYTVDMTGSGDNQRSGASFRIVLDLADWDRGLATNTPGQAGDPQSRHSRNLFDAWAGGDYFPLLYTRSRIEGAAEETTVLVPR